MSFVAVALALAAATTSAVGAPGSAPIPAGMVEAPCPPPTPLSGADEAAVQALLKPGPMDPKVIAAYLAPAAAKARAQAEAEQKARDWPYLCKYRLANQELLASGKRPHVVFMGNSISELWGVADPSLFGGERIDRGVSGQTTSQMVVRFYADVIRLHPKIVHLLGSANDIAGNTGPTTFADWSNNIAAMAQLARANGIVVVLGSLTPTNNIYWRPQPHTAETVARMNAWLKDYASANGIAFIDYYTPLAGENGAFRPDLSNDGVHPNAAGYTIMRKIVLDALAKAGG